MDLIQFSLTFILRWCSAERINQTVEIIKHTVDIEEKGVKLKLTIVDTPGFGDAVNNNEWWDSDADSTSLLELQLSLTGCWRWDFWLFIKKTGSFLYSFIFKPVGIIHFILEISMGNDKRVNFGLESVKLILIIFSSHFLYPDKPFAFLMFLSSEKCIQMLLRLYFLQICDFVFF